MFNIPEALEPRPTDYSVHFRKGGRIGQAVHVTSYTAIGAAQLAMRERQDLIQSGYRVAWVSHFDEKTKRRVVD